MSAYRAPAVVSAIMPIEKWEAAYAAEKEKYYSIREENNKIINENEIMLEKHNQALLKHEKWEDIFIALVKNGESPQESADKAAQALVMIDSHFPKYPQLKQLKYKYPKVILPPTVEEHMLEWVKHNPKPEE